MKSRLSSFVVLFFLLPACTFAIGVYNVGDTLTVLAHDGLVLRKTAAPEGERIAAVAFGDKVIVLKNEDEKVSNTVEEFPGYKIQGLWVKVKTKAGQEGFVFDGYLSKYPAPGKIVDDQQGAEAYSVAELYLLGKTKKKGVRINLPKVNPQYEHYRQMFKNGAAVVFTGGEGGSSQVITFEKDVTLEEAYLIGKALWLKDMKVKPAIKKTTISVKSEDELWEITIENKAGFSNLTLSHAD